MKWAEFKTGQIIKATINPIDRAANKKLSLHKATVLFKEVTDGDGKRVLIKFDYGSPYGWAMSLNWGVFTRFSQKKKEIVKKYYGTGNGFYWLYEDGMPLAININPDNVFKAVEAYLIHKVEPENFKELVKAHKVAARPRRSGKSRVRGQVGSPVKKAKLKKG